MKILLLELLICLIIGSTLIGIGVHFIPVGGAPAALSTSAGIPTGAPMITIGMGITGILTAITFVNQPNYLIIIAGAIGSMMMISITMFFSNIMHVYGVGVPIASSTFEKDPITGFNQTEYVSQGTKGHGIPTVSFLSGVLGAGLGGIGGSLAFTSIYSELSASLIDINLVITITTIMSLMLFFVIAVVASYNIGGTIQGFYDKKFKQKILPGALSCFIVSVVLSLIYALIVWGLINV